MVVVVVIGVIGVVMGWILSVARHTEVAVIVDVSFCLCFLGLIILLVFLHLLVDFEVGFGLLDEGPAVDVLGADIIFNILVVNFFFIVENVPYLFARELRVRILFIKMLGAETRLGRTCSFA